MPNHLHLVAQQGARPLAALMQPLLRRLAHLLQRSHRLEGPMFWRPYASRACHDPDHVRNAIVYTHLNPVRARLCGEPTDYPWTSHRLYLESAEGGVVVPITPAGRLARVLDPHHALPLFATRPGRRISQLREDYRRFVAWRLRADRLSAAADRPSSPVPDASLAMPALAWGDVHWANLSPLFHSTVATIGRNPEGTPRCRPDLSDLARAALASEAPGPTLELVRGRYGGVRYSRIRHRMIRTMSAAGYRNVEIATFLGVSESAVSKVVCAVRHV